MRNYATYMSCRFGLIEDGGEGIDYHVEEERGEGITLQHPIEGGEVGTYFPFNVDRSPTRGDHLHQAGHSTVVESFFGFH